MSLIISLPFSVWRMFWAKNVLQLFNQIYVEGSATLEVLLLSILPMAVTSGVNILVYSYGKYRQVLIIGFAAIPLITWILLLKIGIITRLDLQDSIGILPNNIARQTPRIVNRIGKKLNSSY